MDCPGLISPHGGTVVNRFSSEPQSLHAQAANLPKLPVSWADLSTIYRIADGTLSPLIGPMVQATFDYVLDHQQLQSHGQPLAWTIPLALPIDTELAQSLRPDQKVAVINPSGQIVATLKIESIFEWDKPRYLQSVYGTDRLDHPGADMVLEADATKTHLVGGPLEVLPRPSVGAFDQYLLEPRQVRERLAEKGWDAAVAFQTRNPLHRAHEYAMVYGLETLLQQGKNAGAILNPLVGETKSDDVSADIRMRTYERLIMSCELGDGDSDAELWSRIGGSVPDRVLLMGLDIKMFYGGPAEAIMHAIYRQNMGFTHIIIGRKHADAPYHDGSAIWGDFDAQEIFDNLEGQLLIEPVKVGFAAFYESIGRVDLMSNHQDEKPVFISGKEVRTTLQSGQMVDPRIMRASTSEILAEAMTQQ